MSDLVTMPRSTSIRNRRGHRDGRADLRPHREDQARGERCRGRVGGAGDGHPIEALCGFVWVPSRDPKQLPVCEKCKGVYEMYKAFNDGLRDTPED